MIGKIYKGAFGVITRQPFRLWGISLLAYYISAAISALCGLLPILGIAISLSISTSMTLIFLRGYRGETPKASQLFDCLKDWQTAKRVIGGMAWMALWIVLWGIIPIVGPIFAIIKIYTYRLTPYILMEEPNVLATEAIKVSAERTNGYRGKMFLADLLVYIIVFFAGLILLGLSLIPIAGIVFSFVLSLFGIACVIFLPLLFGLIKSAFYEEIMQNNSAQNI